MQINLCSGIDKVEYNSARQRFTPKELMISAKGRTKGIRVFPRWRVRPKIEMSIYLATHVHLLVLMRLAACTPCGWAAKTQLRGGMPPARRNCYLFSPVRCTLFQAELYLRISVTVSSMLSSVVSMMIQPSLRRGSIMGSSCW